MMSHYSHLQPDVLCRLFKSYCCSFYGSLYYIVLYCIMRPYTEGRLNRYHNIGIPLENPKSALNLG